MPIVIIGGDLEEWGFIPSFLHTNDPRPVREQFNAHYMGGWNKFDGFKWDKERELLTYPGDPPMKPRSMLLFRDEIVLLFPSSWVMIIQKDDTWEVARMD